MPMKVPTHRTQSRLPQPDRHQMYDRLKRDRRAKAFYHTEAWQRLRQVKLVNTPYCEECMRRNDLVAANVVHHRVEINVEWASRLDIDNLESLCSSCHSRLHACKKQ